MDMLGNAILAMYGITVSYLAFNIIDRRVKKVEKLRDLSKGPITSPHEHIKKYIPELQGVAIVRLIVSFQKEWENYERREKALYEALSDKERQIVAQAKVISVMHLGRHKQKAENGSLNRDIRAMHIITAKLDKTIEELISMGRG